MALTDLALWNRLMGFQYAKPEAGGLVARVMKDQGLSKAKAQSRVDAYMRFIYLVAVSSEVLSPSKAVDAVWHLHLEDTAGYRDRFCVPIIGRVINHHEGRPSPARDPAYRRSLTRYREEFGSKPDAKLWPAPEHSNSAVISVSIAAAASFVLAYLTGEAVVYLIAIALMLQAVLLWTKTAKANAKGGCSSGCGGSSSGHSHSGASTSGSSDGSSDGGGGDGGGGGCGGD